MLAKKGSSELREEKRKLLFSVLTFSPSSRSSLLLDIHETWVLRKATLWSFLSSLHGSYFVFRRRPDRYSGSLPELPGLPVLLLPASCFSMLLSRAYLFVLKEDPSAFAPRPLTPLLGQPSAVLVSLKSPGHVGSADGCLVTKTETSYLLGSSCCAVLLGLPLRLYTPLLAPRNYGRILIPWIMWGTPRTTGSAVRQQHACYNSSFSHVTRGKSMTEAVTETSRRFCSCPISWYSCSFRQAVAGRSVNVSTARAAAW